MNPALFWVITQRVLVISYRRFGTTYRSYLQGLRMRIWGQDLFKVWFQINILSAKIKFLPHILGRKPPKKCQKFKLWAVPTDNHIKLMFSIAKCLSEYLGWNVSVKHNYVIYVITLYYIWRATCFDSESLSGPQELDPYTSSSFCRAPVANAPGCTAAIGLLYYP
jgi:hypothetical protein